MATTVLTGRELVLTIEAVDYSDQILSAVLTIETERLTFDTVSGRAYKVVDKNATLDIEFLADWSVAVPNGLSRALWAAADSAVNTSLTAILTATTGDTFTFEVLPNFPNVGGAASEGQTQSLSLQVDGAITESFAA
jgi:hypothetical protein